MHEMVNLMLRVFYHNSKNLKENKTSGEKVWIELEVIGIKEND